MFSQTDIDKINILYHCHGGGDSGFAKPDVDRPDLEAKQCSNGHE